MAIRHLWIPDTQIRAGVPIQHIEALGNYIAEKQFEKIIVAGDWWDMPATSNWNSALTQEGLRIQDDIDSGNRGMDLLWRETNKYNCQRKRNRKGPYSPEKHFLFGNHEHHLERFVEQHPVISEMIGYNMLHLEKHGFKTYPFLEPVDIDGILYCHYFCNPMSGRAYGGMIETRIKNVGQSFTQGHAQSFKYGEVEISSGITRHGLVSGAFYMHNEPYKGPQGNAHWRGVIVKHEVKDGTYDIMKVSLNYLLRKYL